MRSFTITGVVLFGDQAYTGIKSGATRWNGLLVLLLLTTAMGRQAAGDQILTIQNGYTGPTGISVGNAPAYTYQGVNVINTFSGTGNLSIGAQDSSIVNVSGGGAWSIGGNDSSTINISGGQTNFVNADGSSTLNLSSGGIFQAAVFGNAQMSMTGGGIGDNLYIQQNGFVNLSGGSVADLELSQDASGIISGGSLTSIETSDSSTLMVTGSSLFTGFARVSPLDRALSTFLAARSQTRVI